mmetsp:Transcript_2016/g.2961  ORF Transcript_2016/g.2961 Transcript_2016/m.2961 type:complete len:87 (+) Transcript_2016:126-386(+)
MNSASHVVLTGGSAGGVAAFMWADYVKDIIPSTAKYHTIPDSGFGVSVNNIHTKTPLTELQIQALYKISNKDAPMPNEACVKDNKN